MVLRDGSSLTFPRGFFTTVHAFTRGLLHGSREWLPQVQFATVPFERCRSGSIRWFCWGRYTYAGVATWGTIVENPRERTFVK